MKIIIKVVEVAKELRRKYKDFFLWDLMLFPRRYMRRWSIKKKISKIYNPVLNTPSLRCNPDAEIEIHTLTNHYYVPMYLGALKSFLRFYDNVAVIVHDDGSLAGNDQNLLKEHVKGIRIIDRRSADRETGKALDKFPNCKKYRQKILDSFQVFDFLLLGKKNKFISMDCDLLFLKKPQELINWVINKNRQILALYEECPFYQSDVLSRLGVIFTPHVNAAIFCAYKEIIDMKFIENILSEVKLDWYLAQTLYAISAYNKSEDYKLAFLDKDTYNCNGKTNVSDKTILNHYMSSAWEPALKQQEDDAKRVIRELSNKPHLL